MQRRRKEHGRRLSKWGQVGGGWVLYEAICGFRAVLELSKRQRQKGDGSMPKKALTASSCSPKEGAWRVQLEDTCSSFPAMLALPPTGSWVFSLAWGMLCTQVANLPRSAWQVWVDVIKDVLGLLWRWSVSIYRAPSICQVPCSMPHLIPASRYCVIIPHFLMWQQGHREVQQLSQSSVELAFKLKSFSAEILTPTAALFGLIIRPIFLLMPVSWLLESSTPWFCTGHTN